VSDLFPIFWVDKHSWTVDNRSTDRTAPQRPTNPIGQPPPKQMTTESITNTTALGILAAAKASLLDVGYARLSTRAIAEQAGVPLSQIHYHFGSKQNLVLAILEIENQRLIDRQETLFGSVAPLWKQWDQACQFLEEDIASGYVRVLNEMIAAGWSDDVVGAAVWKQLKRWNDLLTEVARRATERFPAANGLAADEMAALISAVFIGAEAILLLGVDEKEFKVRQALRSITDLLREAEDGDDAR